MLKRSNVGLVVGFIFILMFCRCSLFAQGIPVNKESSNQSDSRSGSEISVVLEEDDQVVVDVKGICIIPIMAVQRLELGSISLVIEFPDEVLDILDVTSKIKGKMLYTIVDGVLRISWYSLIPIKIKPGDELIRLKCRNTNLNPLNNTKKHSTQDKDLNLRIRPISMISNGRSVNMSNVVLTYPRISAK